MNSLAQKIEQALGVLPVKVGPLTGGCVGQVYRIELADGSRLVAKVDDRPQPNLDIEGFMLDYLARHSDLPVPEVRHNHPRLLIISFLPGSSRFSAGAQAHAAELLATLHNINAPQYGLERDTLIGGLNQPNLWTDSWVDFFREQRLLYMARDAYQAGRLSGRLLGRVETFAGKLERWLVEPDRPGLIHGDVWTANVLADGQRITGFIDPAIYYADPEIELAFITLFSSFGDAFFGPYQERRPIPAGFFEARRDIYNLYPLLVHSRLFGGGYPASVARILDRFGF
jgi:fructosamine-3-kinase